MSDKFSLDDVLDAMAAAPTLTEMNLLLAEIRENFGLANIVYHAAQLPGCAIPNPILLLTYDDQWVKKYLSENYFEMDPVVAHGCRSFLPLDWSKIDKRPNDVSHFFGSAESHGVGRQGITIPVRGPQGEKALFTITSNLTSEEWDRRRVGLLRDYHVLAHFFHDRAAFLSGRRESVAKLSKREHQCVELLAKGLQPKVIAYRLGLSESAVRLYTKSAKHKLRCTTLAQTVAEAMRLELISA